MVHRHGRPAGTDDGCHPPGHWYPSFGLDRELDWLAHMDDWMISKKRYWGLALPIYECTSCGNVDVIGSEDELKQRAVEGWDAFEGHSPHRPWIDSVEIACSNCGQVVSRITDVGNPWLDAGIVAFSTLNYRQDPEYWAKWYPADLISESFPGQFRNWFYSVIAQSTALVERPAFRTVFSYALMRDEKGEEMHKSKGNAIWFDEAAEEIGVDVMRWLFARANPDSNVNFGYHIADDVRRRFILPLWNSFSFYTTYAAIDRFDPSAPRIRFRLPSGHFWTAGSSPSFTDLLPRFGQRLTTTHPIELPVPSSDSPSKNSRTGTSAAIDVAFGNPKTTPTKPPPTRRSTKHSPH